MIFDPFDRFYILPFVLLRELSLSWNICNLFTYSIFFLAGEHLVLLHMKSFKGYMKAGAGEKRESIKGCYWRLSNLWVTGHLAKSFHFGSNGQEQEFSSQDQKIRPNTLEDITVEFFPRKTGKTWKNCRFFNVKIDILSFKLPILCQNI